MNNSKQALFLDRDGVINIDHGYVYQTQDISFVKGIFELCKKAQALGYQIIIVTNQSGIARDIYSESDFLKLMQWMQIQFKQKGVNITDVYYCPHHPSQGVNHFVSQCECRKPKPGMILSAIEKHHIAPEHSYFIGDKATDIQAANSANIKHLFIFNSKTNINEELEKLTIELKNKVKKVTELSDVINYF